MLESPTSTSSVMESSTDSISVNSCGSLDWMWKPRDESDVILDNVQRVADNLYMELLARLLAYINRYCSRDEICQTVE